MNDLLHHKGTRWRKDTISVLCSPAFRGTLLRVVFWKTSTIDGTAVKDFESFSNVGGVETLIAGRGESPRAGASAVDCASIGGGGAAETANTLRSTSDQDAVATEDKYLGYARDVGRTGPNGVVLGHVDNNLVSLALALKDRHAAGRCEVAAADELVIPLRLGDGVSVRTLRTISCTMHKQIHACAMMIAGLPNAATPDAPGVVLTVGLVQ